LLHDRKDFQHGNYSNTPLTAEKCPSLSDAVGPGHYIVETQRRGFKTLRSEKKIAAMDEGSGAAQYP
jgi:hypothetical protein